MADVPSISQKELLELADRLLSHRCLAEKLGYYASQTGDEELRHMLHHHQQIVVRQCEEMASTLRGLQRETGWGAYHRQDDPNTRPGYPWRYEKGVM